MIKEHTIPCILCKGLTVLKIDCQDLWDWRHGKFAQDAFPYLNADQREVLISNICQGCFDKMYPDE